MKPKLFLAASLLLLFVAFTLRGQNSNSDDSGHLLALETAWNHALESKDAKALDMLLAIDMVSLDSDGSLMNKSEYLAGIKAPSYQPGQVVHEKVNVQLYGESAVVSGIYREKNTEKGKSSTHRASFVDTWVKIKGTWQCVASTAVEIPAKQTVAN